MSSPKVIYYKDISNDARALSSKYEIRDVGGIFWEVKATRKEGEQEYDLVKEFDLCSASPPTDEFWKEYQRDTRALQRIFEKSGKIAPEALKKWKAPYDKALKERKNIDEQEIISRRRFWHAGGGGFYIVSRHPGTDDNPEGHGPVAYFTFWKEALEAEWAEKPQESVSRPHQIFPTSAITVRLATVSSIDQIIWQSDRDIRSPVAGVD